MRALPRLRGGAGSTGGIRLTVRNFKRFSEVEVELGSPVVFIGPNNSAVAGACATRT